VLNLSYAELAKCACGLTDDRKHVIHQDHTTRFHDTFHLSQDACAISTASGVMKRQTREDYVKGRVVKRHLARIGLPELNPIHHIYVARQPGLQLCDLLPCGLKDLWHDRRDLRAAPPGISA
jgi:hypothetical protein